MKAFTTLAIIGLAAVGFTQSSQRSILTTPTNIALRLGLGVSFDDDVRDVMGTQIGVGFDYYFDRPLLPNGDTFLSIDWLGRGINGDKGNIFPLMLNHKWYGARNMETYRRTYAFAGLGVAVMDVESTATVLAARGGLGLELSDNIFVEGVVLLSGSKNGNSATGLGAYIGYRF